MTDPHHSPWVKQRPGQPAKRCFGGSELKFSDIRRTFEQALELAGDCYRAYQLATPQVRRMFD